MKRKIISYVLSFALFLPALFSLFACNEKTFYSVKTTVLGKSNYANVSYSGDSDSTDSYSADVEFKEGYSHTGFVFRVNGKAVEGTWSFSEDGETWQDTTKNDANVYTLRKFSYVTNLNKNIECEINLSSCRMVNMYLSVSSDLKKSIKYYKYLDGALDTKNLDDYVFDFDSTNGGLSEEKTLSMFSAEQVIVPYKQVLLLFTDKMFNSIGVYDNEDVYTASEVGTITQLVNHNGIPLTSGEGYYIYRIDFSLGKLDKSVYYLKTKSKYDYQDKFATFYANKNVAQVASLVDESISRFVYVENNDLNEIGKQFRTGDYAQNVTIDEKQYTEVVATNNLYLYYGENYAEDFAKNAMQNRDIAEKVDDEDWYTRDGIYLDGDESYTSGVFRNYYLELGDGYNEGVKYYLYSFDGSKRTELQPKQKMVTLQNSEVVEPQEKYVLEINADTISKFKFTDTEYDFVTAGCYLVAVFDSTKASEYVGVRNNAFGKIDWYNDSNETINGSDNFHMEYDIANATSITYVKKSAIFNDSGNYNKLIWSYQGLLSFHPTTYKLKVKVDDTIKEFTVNPLVSGDNIVYTVNLLQDNDTIDTIASFYEIVDIIPTYLDYTPKGVRLDISSFSSAGYNYLYMYKGTSIDTDFSHWIKLTADDLQNEIVLEDGEFVWFATDASLDYSSYYEKTDGDDTTKVNYGIFYRYNDLVGREINHIISTGDFGETSTLTVYYFNSISDVKLGSDIVVKLESY